MERRSHLISIGAAKLSFVGAKLRWKRGEGGGSGKCLKKWCDFVHSRVFLARIFFFFFLRHFLSVLSYDFIGAACRTNRKYW